MDEQRYALIELQIGPLPAHVTNWDDAALEAISDAALEVAHRFHHPWPDSDTDVSGQIVKVILTDDDLALTNTGAWLGAKIHHYVSTYCLHGHHTDCRQTCKFAEEHDDDGQCRCQCHRGEAPKPHGSPGPGSG